MKFWYSICLFFCFYNIIILTSEKYKVSYQLDSEYKSKKLTYLSCMFLNKILNVTKFRLNELDETLNNYFNQTSVSSYYEYKKEKFLTQIKVKDYVIYRDQFCLTSDFSDLEALSKIFKFNNLFVYDKDVFDFFRLKSFFSKLNRLIIFQKEFPYSRCKTFSNNFKCLNRCVKEKQNLSKYFYEGNENVLIHLSYQNMDKIKDIEKRCDHICKDEKSCRFNHFKIVHNQFNNLMKENSKTTIIRAFPSITKFDYLIQLVSLICLFSNISFFQISFKLTKQLNFKFQKYKKFINFFIFFVWVSCFWSLFIKSGLDFIEKLNNPTTREVKSSIFDPEEFSLIFCEDIKNTLKNSTLDFHKTTLFDLEKITSTKLESNKIKIYLKFQNKVIDVEWNFDPKVIFYGFKKDKLSRCHIIKLNIYEPKYQSLLAISKLNLLIESKVYQLFLVPKGQKFTNNSYQIYDEYSYLKKETRRSKLNKKCFVYHKDNNLGCKDRFDCIHKCAQRNFFNQNNHRKISGWRIVEKDLFKKEEWGNAFIFFNDSFFENLNQCEKIYDKPDCHEIKFQKDIKIDKINGIVKLDLYYDLQIRIEEEVSIYKFLLEILNILSIIFGSNFFKFLMVIFNYLKINFKFYKLLVYLFCTIGFSYHFCFIIDELMNENYIYSQYYKLTDSIEMKYLVFCFVFNNESIDLNHKLNYKYLDKMTKDIRTSSLFNRIDYLDKQYQWTSLDVKLQLNKDQKELNIETYYFLNKKCFEVKYNMKYNQNRLYFEKNYNQVLKIKLNRAFMSEYNLICYFLTRIKNTLQFSKLNYLDFQNHKMNKAYGYAIESEFFEIEFNDKFNLIKNPLSLLYGSNNLNDANQYLNKLVSNFKLICQMQTLNFPLNRDKYDSNLEFSEHLFDQYYRQIQNETDYKTPSNLNYKRQFIINNLDKYPIDESDFDIKFSLIFFKRILEITSEDNYAKLLLNILNLFSFWFNFNVLDLHIFIYKIKFITASLHKMISKTKNHLNKLVQSEIIINRS